ncbi:transposase [Limosilactobacillus fermentum]
MVTPLKTLMGFSVHLNVQLKFYNLPYSKKAYPWDNACIESFHALIKREWINRFKIHSYSEAKRLVFQYIETFYNTVRIHSHCGFKSPKQLEDEYQTQIQNLVVA